MGAVNNAQVSYPSVWHTFFPSGTPDSMAVNVMLFRSIWYNMEVKEVINILDSPPEEFKKKLLELSRTLPQRFPFWKDECDKFVVGIELSQFDTLNQRMRKHISLYTLKQINKSHPFKNLGELCDVLEKGEHAVCSTTKRILNTTAGIGMQLEGKAPVTVQPQTDWETFVSFNKFLKKRGEFDRGTVLTQEVKNKEEMKEQTLPVPRPIPQNPLTQATNISRKPLLDQFIKMNGARCPYGNAAEMNGSYCPYENVANW